METATMTDAELGNARKAELARLVQEHGGTVRPSQVVDAARHPDSPLHGIFTWDDGEAACKWRLHEAQKYLRILVTSVRVDGSDDPVRVRAFVSIPSDRVDGAYRPMEAVLDDPLLLGQLLVSAREDFTAFRRKYGHLQQLSKALQAMDEALQ